MNIDIQHFKNLLSEELSKLNSELETNGSKDESTGTAWSAVQNDDQDAADREEVAGNMEVFENKENIVSILETQKNEVVSALEKIEKGTYGICEIDGKEIEKERLEANPSAKTCISCLNK
jgi:DnaK suppressor protein